MCAVFFDIRKAFDSVPHRALLEKLERLDINPVLVRWICSYLMGRRQKVVVDGETSESISVDSGVPQGSVLGVDNWGEVALSLQLRMRIKKTVSGRKAARMYFTQPEGSVAHCTHFKS